MNIEVNKTNVKVEGNNLVIELTEELRKSLGMRQEKQLYECKVGNVIVDDIGNEWYVVEQDIENNRTKVWKKELIDGTYKFDNGSNDFRTSEIKNVLNDENGKILSDIYKGFGKENVLLDTVDLLSMDGLDTYGTCNCKVHLGTFDDYRKARKNGMFRTENEKPFWLDTPDSTNEGCSASCVQVVRRDGGVGCDGCCWDGYGVRPFCSLDSSICVSVE
ncbi:hypothetical protein PNX04_05935 [[Ruminococcus] gnavus]|uniref:DUF6273 domain-containing protein n=1 Tax=Mediterraneibacter gnavus TaxID=33038 RepID=UPI00232E6657|nr:DUF6273 domain-containing protein [Mediterraneibacter gnavus]MDB8706549.1 hypothetical protein [Mediterraneibacter gnavus]